MTLLDVKALVAFTEGSEDIVSLEDVLHMVLGLLGRKSLALAFADHVNTLGGCQIFMSLLKRYLSLQIASIDLFPFFLFATVQYTKVYVETVVNEIVKDWHEFWTLHSSCITVHSNLDQLDFCFWFDYFQSWFQMVISHP